MSPAALGVVVGVILLAVVAILVTITRNLYVCSPSEVLIFSGRRWKAEGEKEEIGFRVVRGGRAMRMPLFEVVDRMQLTNMAIELSVQNAFSRGGIPLKVHAVEGDTAGTLATPPLVEAFLTVSRRMERAAGWSLRESRAPPAATGQSRSAGAHTPTARRAC